MTPGSEPSAHGFHGSAPAAQPASAAWHSFWHSRLKFPISCPAARSSISTREQFAQATPVGGSPHAMTPVSRSMAPNGGVEWFDDRASGLEKRQSTAAPISA
jgi:hypothetical protein